MPVQTRAMTQGRRPNSTEPPAKKQRTGPAKKTAATTDKNQPTKPRKQNAKSAKTKEAAAKGPGKKGGRKPKAQKSGDDKKEKEEVEGTKPKAQKSGDDKKEIEGKKEKKQGKKNENNKPEEIKEVEEKTEPITEGKEAPAFSNIPNEKGTNVSLKDYAGKYLVLYFYVKDNTAGCKKEGQKFNELYKDFQDLNCEILGVSGGDSKSHQDFKDKEKFSFSLLADTQQKVMKLFNVVQRKRATFLIDGDRKIVKIWSSVKNIEKHPADVLNALKGYQSTHADDKGNGAKKPEE